MIDLLEKLGLSEGEARVYLATLELGTDTVQNISKKAGSKRPTAYLLLDALVNKGLVAKTPKKTTTVYTAEPPERLEAIMKERLAVLEKTIPELKALYNQAKEKPKVKLYEGKEGVRLVYEEIFVQKEIWWFGSIEYLIKYFGEELVQKFEKISRQNKTIVRDLLTQKPVDIEYLKRNKAEYYQVKVLPPDFPYNPKIDIAIYGNKIAFFSASQEIFVLVVEGSDVVENLKAMYELAWQSAVELTTN